MRKGEKGVCECWEYEEGMIWCKRVGDQKINKTYNLNKIFECGDIPNLTSFIDGPKHFELYSPSVEPPKTTSSAYPSEVRL